MTPSSIVVYIIAVILAFTCHEWAHAVVANGLGDTTAQRRGRLTLNPLKHLDPVGSFLVPVVLVVGQLLTLGSVQFAYGWGRPVPVQPLNLRSRGGASPRQLMALVAAAGPAMNFLLAAVGAGLFRLLVTADLPVGRNALLAFILVNLIMGVFNLIPIPPFDGGRIVVGILPEALARHYAKIERLGVGALLLLIVLLPMVLRQLGVQIDPVGDLLRYVANWGVNLLSN